VLINNVLHAERDMMSPSLVEPTHRIVCPYQLQKVFREIHHASDESHDPLPHRIGEGHNRFRFRLETGGGGEETATDERGGGRG
jgi:hypothetical protein